MAAGWRQAISTTLREVRLHLCQSSPASKGAREFVEKHYVGLKQQNPTFPFLIRECSGVTPKLYVRYAEIPIEKSASLDNLTSDEILQRLQKLVETPSEA
ncbi:uncharacterized protein [Dysidea avara]|uniref:uncharacterized protein n=1 Tax=Dysidea avara TaxID=196820 RepID=UPI00332A955D